jgi:hypothetical protein
MRNLRIRLAMALLLTVYWCVPAQAQFLMDLIDTTKDAGKGMFNLYKKYDHLQISGYLQPQFQVASDTSVNSFSGGNFGSGSNNRFTLRRGRIRFDYARFTKDHFPSLQFVFQFDGTERGVFIRDFWGRAWDSKWQLYSFTAGMFARPFGYEVNYGSADREAPERGRMSQILMRTERDLGAMVSFEPQNKSHRLYKLKIDAGLFNGQGLSGPLEYDSYKDFIGQVYWKQTEIAHNLLLSGGISFLEGGIKQPGKYRFVIKHSAGNAGVFLADSLHKPGSKMPRRYSGINAQLKWKNKWGATELRGEYWQGVQTGTRASSETPGTIAYGDNLYVRKFSGGFITFVQSIVTPNNQLIVKYDWYDANRDVKGLEIGSPGSNLNQADITFRTFGLGVLHQFNENLKLLLFYDIVKNESTSLASYQSDVSDNVLTCRLQFRF